MSFTLAGCGGTETNFSTVISPDGTSRLIVNVTEPNLPHARHIVSVLVNIDGVQGDQKLIETKLANDGVPFTERNIGVRWTGARAALVCLRPTDLPDRGIRIQLDPKPSAEIKEGC